MEEEPSPTPPHSPSPSPLTPIPTPPSLSHSPSPLTPTPIPTPSPTSSPSVPSSPAPPSSSPSSPKPSRVPTPLDTTQLPDPKEPLTLESSVNRILDCSLLANKLCENTIQSLSTQATPGSHQSLRTIYKQIQTIKETNRMVEIQLNMLANKLKAVGKGSYDSYQTNYHHHNLLGTEEEAPTAAGGEEDAGESSGDGEESSTGGSVYVNPIPSGGEPPRQAPLSSSYQSYSSQYDADTYEISESYGSPPPPSEYEAANTYTTSQTQATPRVPSEYLTGGIMDETVQENVSDSDSEGGASPSASLSSWDVEFYKLRCIENFTDNEYKSVSELGDNFLTAASTFTMMIVGEQHCPLEQKKIMPLDVGGVAGGTKFEVHGLFFKYPVDSEVGGKWLYGGNSPNDIYAAKASNQDLLGSVYCNMADTKKKFNFPLFALIDYQGYRLTVMTHLPITDDSLVYGSADAGRTMHNDPNVHEYLSEIAKELHLRPHLASISSPTEMCLCGDIEVHQIPYHDKELYFVLDTARVFPPALPSNFLQPRNGEIFFRMLRPEHIKTLKGKIPPLSSDALSAWQSKDPFSLEMNADVLLATQILEQNVRDFAAELINHKMNAKIIDSALASTRHPTFNGVPFKDTLIREMHIRGINIRYLGIITTELARRMKNLSNPNTKMINFLVSLMITRTLKNMWRSQIRLTTPHGTYGSRKSNETVHSTCLKETEKFLNAALSMQKVTKLWNKIISFVENMFANGTMINPTERQSLLTIFGDTQKHLFLSWIIIRFCLLTGIVISPNALQTLNSENLLYAFKFSRADLVSFVANMKCSPILDYYMGIHYFLKGRKEEMIGSKLTSFKAAYERLENVVHYNFPSVWEYYAESLFGGIKLDRNVVGEGDWDVISEQYYKIWNNVNSERLKDKTRKEYFNFICSVLWRLFRQPWQEKDIPPSRANISLSNSEITTHLLDCLPSTHLQTKTIIELLQKTERRNIYISNMLELLISSNKKFNDAAPNNLLNYFNLATMKQIIEETRNWDIDMDYKWWFYSNYFSLPELIAFCELNSISKLGDMISNRFIFCPYPLLSAAFHYGSLQLCQTLRRLGIDDPQFTAILNSCNEEGETALHVGVDQGLSDVVQLLIDCGIDVNATNNEQESPLIRAAIKSLQPISEILVNANCNLNQQDKLGNTAIHIAAKNSNLKLVQFLISKGCSISLTNKWGATPLHLACELNNDKIISLLCENGADIEAVNLSGQTCYEIAKNNNNYPITAYLTNLLQKKYPVYFAVLDNKITQLQALLEKGLDINSHPQKNKGMTPLHLAITKGNFNIVKTLIENGCYMHPRDEDGMTPLHYAIGKSSLFSMLLPLCKFNLNFQEHKFGYSPLHLAVEKGETDMVKQLIEASCNLNILSKDGLSALHVAVEGGNIQIVTSLIKSNCNLDIVDKKNGETPLHYALSGGKTNCASLLLYGKCNVNIQEKSGLSPLHFSAYYGNVIIAKLLLEFNCNPDCTDKYGFNALHVAAKKGNADVVQMLLECGFDPNRVDNYKESPLHKAAYYNHPLPVSLLVGAGAENSPNNEGKTPYDLAVSKGARPVAKYFKSAGFKKTYTVWEAISLHDFDSLGEILSNKRFVNIPDNDKVTPIFHAIKHGFDDAVKLLVNSKADLKARDLDGNTPLHYAVINQATNIIELLNKEDCKQIKNAKGQTPVALAHNTANRKIISLLR